MFSLKLRMFLLTVIFFGVIYAIISVIGYSIGINNFAFYLGLSLVILFIQYLLGPKLVEWTMHVRYIKENEEPKLHQMVSDLSQRANVPKPRIGIAQIALPNAFAFGRWRSDARICVTEGILKLLNDEELRAVLGHEMTHLKSSDVLTITLLSVIPLVLYRIAWYMMWSRGDRRRDSGNAALIGLLAFVFYFVTNLLVLYASRIREYFADRGSVDLGNPAHTLASALYKLVYGSARADKESLQEVQGLKAFFVNDPSRSINELRDLKGLDLDRSGTIDATELLSLRQKTVKPNFADKLMEILSTHPNMLKRIKQLSSYV